MKRTVSLTLDRQEIARIQAALSTTKRILVVRGARTIKVFSPTGYAAMQAVGRRRAKVLHGGRP